MGEKQKADFGGYATRNDLECSDGLTIKGGAFTHNDGKQIPLVWHHQGANSAENILGHAILENRSDGVYAYGFFNESDNAKYAKEAVRHGDINMLSIFANQLQKTGIGRKDVVHGEIREVSLVMAGANPGAFIDSVSFSHSDGTALNEDEGVITTSDDETIDPSPAAISSDNSSTEVPPEVTPPVVTPDAEINHADSSTQNKRSKYRG